MRRFRLCALCLLCVVTTGCGEAEPVVPAHGLDTKGLESKPQGEAVTLQYDLRHEAAYKAVLSMRTEVFKRGTEDGRTKDQTLALDATLEHVWTIHRPTPDAPMTSSVELRYVAARGHGAEKLLQREVLTGRLAHDTKGAAMPLSLNLRGGTKAEQVEMLDLVGSLLLAGYGGAPSWLPPHPVRAGEAWALEPHLRLRALANIAQRARELGVDAPRPTFRGTARLRRVQPGPDGPLLELELDALIELAGTLRMDDGRTGSISSGDRYKGQATVEARTGVPTRFDVSHVHRQHVRSGRDDYVIGSDVTIRATVTRTAAGR